MYLTKTHLSPENQEVLKDVVEEYRDKLQRGVYRQHSKVDAWNKVLERFKQRAKREGFAPDSKIEATPIKRKRKTKRKRSTKKGSKFLGEPIPKSPQRTRVINAVSEWVRGYGIKPRS